MNCQCETCRLHDQLAEALKDRDVWKQRYQLAAEVIERNALPVNYAEAVQIEQARVAG